MGLDMDKGMDKGMDKVDKQAQGMEPAEMLRLQLLNL